MVAMADFSSPASLTGCCAASAYPGVDCVARNPFQPRPSYLGRRFWLYFEAAHFSWRLNNYFGLPQAACLNRSALWVSPATSFLRLCPASPWKEVTSLLPHLDGDRLKVTSVSEKRKVSQGVSLAAIGDSRGERGLIGMICRSKPNRLPVWFEHS